ncbi:flagellar motor switch protein FliN [Candidatus Fermentibacteria bacterium]|nr:MAG: flagellar motor switch protein FliN [Candidatus Fermentibacteria bacterium]
MDENTNTESVDAAGEGDALEDAVELKKQQLEDQNNEISGVELPQISESKDASENGDKDLNLKMILDIPVDVRVELGNAMIPIREVLGLGEGSIVELDRLAGHPADIVVNGRLIGEGDVVVVNDNFGVRITKLVDPEDRF